MQSIRLAECSSPINNNEAAVQLMFAQCCYAILILQCSHTITRKALPLAATEAGIHVCTFQPFGSQLQPTATILQYCILCAATERKFMWLQTPSYAHSLTNTETLQIFFPVCHPTSPNSATWIPNPILYIIWFWLHHFRPMKKENIFEMFCIFLKFKIGNFEIYLATPSSMCLSLWIMIYKWKSNAKIVVLWMRWSK